MNAKGMPCFTYKKTGTLPPKEYVEINGVSRQTAYAELKDMTDKGLFTAIGKGRATKYVRKVGD